MQFDSHLVKWFGGWGVSTCVSLYHVTKACDRGRGLFYAMLSYKRVLTHQTRHCL